MKYDILLFDADDTLFDFKACERKAFTENMEAHGVRVVPDMVECYSAFNDFCWKELERGEIEKSELVVKRYKLFLDHYKIAFDPKEINDGYEKALSEVAILLPYALKMVKRLSKKARMYIITNGLTAVQEGRFKKSPITPYFSDIFISEQLGSKKPDKLFFDLIEKKIPDFDKCRAVVIGDSLTSDIKGGNNAGIDCIWCNFRGKERLSGYEIIKEVANLEELTEYLEGEM